MQQALLLGLADEARVHLAPVLLGGGSSLFGSLDCAIGLEHASTSAAPAATHIDLRVIR